MAYEVKKFTERKNKKYNKSINIKQMWFIFAI